MMTNPNEQKLDEILSGLASTYRLSMMYGNEAQQNIDRFVDPVYELFEMEYSADIGKRIANELADDQIHSIGSVDEFESTYQKLYTEQNKKIDPKQIPRFQKYIENLNTIKTEVEELKNIEREPENTTETETNATNNTQGDTSMDLTVIPTFVDPITRKNILIAVRNRYCGHIYEKDTILGIINQKHGVRKIMRCPFSGCQNTMPIQPQDLIEDKNYQPEMEKRNNDEE